MVWTLSPAQHHHTQESIDKEDEATGRHADVTTGSMRADHVTLLGELGKWVGVSKARVSGVLLVKSGVDGDGGGEQAVESSKGNAVLQVSVEGMVGEEIHMGFIEWLALDHFNNGCVQVVHCSIPNLNPNPNTTRHVTYASLNTVTITSDGKCLST